MAALGAVGAVALSSIALQEKSRRDGIEANFKEMDERIEEALTLLRTAAKRPASEEAPDLLVRADDYLYAAGFSAFHAIRAGSSHQEVATLHLRVATVLTKRADAIRKLIPHRAGAAEPTYEHMKSIATADDQSAALQCVEALELEKESTKGVRPKTWYMLTLATYRLHKADPPVALPGYQKRYNFEIVATDAISAYERALIETPDNGEVYYYLGKIRELQGTEDLAREAYARAWTIIDKWKQRRWGPNRRPDWLDEDEMRSLSKHAPLDREPELKSILKF